jgi:hypothetical protein
MLVDKEFVLPPVEVEKPVMSEDKASDTAFYAAGASSVNPIEDYHQIYADLTQKGSSQAIDNATKAWEQEQDVGTKQTIKGIIEDPNIPTENKRQILNTYAMGGYVSKDLKDKYVQKAASLELGTTKQDEVAQDAVLANLRTRLSKVSDQEHRDNIVKGEATLGTYFTAFGQVGADILTGLGAGVVGTLNAIWERDAVSGKELANRLAQDWATIPKDQATANLKQNIGQKLAVLGVPAEKVKEFVMRTTDSADLGIIAGVAGDPLNLIPVGAASKIIGATKKGVGATIRAGSPMDVTAASNPKLASELATGALEDASEQTARAMGTNRAAIVNEMVLPKPLSSVERRQFPDLSRNLDLLDADMEQVFKAHRFDPNIQDVTQRRKDLDTVYSILNESRGPRYLQNQSLISSTDNVFEGTAVFGRDSNYFYHNRDDVINAYNNISDSVSRLPEAERGQLFIVDKVTGTKYTPETLSQLPLIETAEDLLSVKQYSVEWSWKKEYDDLSMRLFGKDAVKTSILGIDASGIASSKVGNWLFGHGRFPKWFESSALRQAERSSAQASVSINVIRNNIANTKFKKELSSLVTDAEELGKEFYTFKEIETRFPNLSTSQAKELFETHTYWRRINHYNHALANDMFARKLVTEGFNKGLYIDDKYFGAVNDSLKFAHKGETPRKIWDMDLEQPFNFTWLDTKKDAAYDIGGKKLVALKKPVVAESGEIYNYALVGGAKSRTSHLPQRVLPRIPGYSPIKTKAHFFIDSTPTKLTVDGVEIGDPARLRTYTRTVAAAKTEYEAKLLQKELQAKNPDNVIRYRADRGASFGRIIDDYEAHGDVLRNAMERGERLPSIDGPAPIEDRLVSLVKTTQTLARQNSLQVWEQATKEAFMKDFAEFLPNKEFPETLSDIRPLPNMNREEARQFSNAQRVFEYYAKIKTFETASDFLWKGTLHYVADILEKWKVPASSVRDIANKGNLLIEFPRQLASMLFIHLMPIKQWIIQPAQLLEIYAIHPASAMKNLTDLGGVRMALASDAPMLKGKGKAFYEAAKKLSPGMDAREFNLTVQALKESGIMQSVDLNMLVHGVIHDTERGLTEGSWEKIYNDIKAVPRGAVQAVRGIGFDFAELNNRVGLWMIVKDMWKERNPGKNWNTPEVKEAISVEALKLSGAMNRAGSLPYQSGALSVMFQFAAITQKLTMNLIQDNATMLSAGQRARLVAARSALWGAKYGLPAGALIYYYLDRSEDPAVREASEVLKRGLADRAGNALLKAISGADESDVSFSKSMSPYGELTSGLPYIDVAYEMAKMFDDKPAGPRFPAFGAVTSLGSAVDKMQSWFITKDVTGESFTKAVWEATKVASMMSNWAQGQLLLSTKDKISKNGNHLGLDATAAEAFGQTLGFTTWREEDLWQQVGEIQDRKYMIKSMATDIHQWMVNQENQMGEGSIESHFDMLNSFVSILQTNDTWTEQDIREVYDQVVDMDRQKYKDINTSILMTLLKSRTDENDEQLKFVENKLRLSTNPETIELLEILDGKRKP